MIRLYRQPSAKLRSAKARRSTIGFLALSTRAKKPIPASVPITAKVKIDRSSNQSQRGPSSNTYSRLPRNSAISASPAKSKPLSSSRFGLSNLTRNHTPVVTSTPGMTLIRNSQCQEKAWVR